MPRPDVIVSLETLSDRDSHNAWLAGKQTWPDLTNTIHWLIDDTWWDDHPTADDVGTLLRSAEEAEAVQRPVDLLLQMIEDLEPTDDDALYVSHPHWESLVHASAQALLVLRELDTPQDQNG